MGKVKLLAAALAAVMLMPLFTSCSSSKSASKNAGTNNSEVAENKETDLTAQDGLSCRVAVRG